VSGNEGKPDKEVNSAVTAKIPKDDVPSNSNRSTSVPRTTGSSNTAGVPTNVSNVTNKATEVSKTVATNSPPTISDDKAPSLQSVPPATIVRSAGGGSTEFTEQARQKITDSLGPEKLSSETELKEHSLHEVRQSSGLTFVQLDRSEVNDNPSASLTMDGDGGSSIDLQSRAGSLGTTPISRKMSSFAEPATVEPPRELLARSSS